MEVLFFILLGLIGQPLVWWDMMADLREADRMNAEYTYGDESYDLSFFYF